METIITCVSKWRHTTTGKTCKVTSRREVSSAKSEFVIEGHNPLPCFSFKGTYKILEEWLKANGWVRVFNESVDRADLIVIHQK